MLELLGVPSFASFFEDCDPYEQWDAPQTVWRVGDQFKLKSSAYKTVELPDGSSSWVFVDGAIAKNKNKQLVCRWRNGWHVVPTCAQIYAWTVDAEPCETPAGEICEPDSPDSWMSLLGLI